MTLTFENINFNDILFSILKELCLVLIIYENNSSNEEMCVRIEIEEKDVKHFLGYFSSMSNTEWINYKTITPKK